MVSTELDRLLSEAAEKIRREAYSAGWRDAVAAVTKAVTEAAELSPGEISASIDLSFASAIPTNGVIPGSTPWYVLQAIKKRAGMKGSEIISVVQEGGHKVSNASVRTALMRLGRKKLIVSHHKKWFAA